MFRCKRSPSKRLMSAPVHVVLSVIALKVSPEVRFNVTSMVEWSMQVAPSTLGVTCMSDGRILTIASELAVTSGVDASTMAGPSSILAAGLLFGDRAPLLMQAAGLFNTC